MLNKPTNIYPYNDFVNTSDGFSFKFSFNNSVTYAVVAVFEKDTDKQVETLLAKGNSFRSLANSEISATISKYSANKDYYWRCYYWINPSPLHQYSNAIPLFSRTSGNLTYHNVPILAWDKAARTIDIQATATYTFDSGKLRTYPYNFSSKCDIGLNSSARTLVNTITADINSGAEYWGTIPGAVSPQKISGFVSDSNGGWKITPKMTCPKNSIGENSTLYVYRLSETQGTNIGLCTAGDCLLFDNDVTLGTSPMLSVESSELVVGESSVLLRIKAAEPFYFDLSYSSSAKNYGMVTGYKNADYNVSPPYFFSVKNKLYTDFGFSPALSNGTEHSPYVKFTAKGEMKDSAGNIQYREFDVDYYYYSLYLQDQTNQSFSLVGQSDKMVDLHMDNDSTSTGSAFYVFDSFIFDGLLWDSTYKLKIWGRSNEGWDFESETVFQTGSFNPSTSVDFISFNSDLGCVEIDNKMFTSNNSNYMLHIYRYDVAKKELCHVYTANYTTDTSTTKRTNTSGDVSYTYKKNTVTYDFNISSSSEYIYYAFLMDGTSIVSSYTSSSIIPEWYGVYLTDLSQASDGNYLPDHSSCWFLNLNYEPAEIERNYSINHPLAISQKYPKSVRGKSNFKTGSVSGLLGHVSCHDDYSEDSLAIEKWDEFCGNGNPKLLRSHVRSENLIADVDKMSSSIFGYTATLTDISYTQIDDINYKKISIEV